MSLPIGELKDFFFEAASRTYASGGANEGDQHSHTMPKYTATIVTNSPTSTPTT